MGLSGFDDGEEDGCVRPELLRLVKRGTNKEWRLPVTVLSEAGGPAQPRHRARGFVGSEVPARRFIAGPRGCCGATPKPATGSRGDGRDENGWLRERPLTPWKDVADCQPAGSGSANRIVGNGRSTPITNVVGRGIDAPQVHCGVGCPSSCGHLTPQNYKRGCRA